MTSSNPTLDHRFQALLGAVRALVHCDAAALLRLQGQALVPVAVDGLLDEALGRRFPIAAHPRLARLLDSPQGLRFEADSPLPDPYDGLVAGKRQELLAVHDCMGATLRYQGQPWGLVTLDALDPAAFDAVAPAQLQAIVQMLEAGIAAQEEIAALARQRAREQSLSRALLSQQMPARELVGKSAALLQLKQEIASVAASELTVLILGETGVGKELVAESLHQLSARRERALVRVNCAALPESLADSELFGHKRGAFTGATQDRSGKFELADGGTLFLDEVGELPLPVQAKLLRVLQSGEIQRPGSDRALKVDVRVLAATNRQLRDEVAQGRFRADLYHRLSVYPLPVPALRERGHDVLALAGGFLEENQHRLGARNLRLSPAASAALLAHDWPGNVRELEHLISRAALRALNEPNAAGRWIGIEPRHLALALALDPPAASRTAPGLPSLAPPVPATEGQGLREATDDFQRQWIAQALARQNGSMAAAARLAGLDRSNFLRLARRLGVAPARKPPAS